MTRTTVRFVMVAFVLGFATLGSSAQTAIGPTSSPTTLGLGTILGDFPYFAGQLVRIPTARVREVISPRAFTIESAITPRSYIDGGQALVVLDKPVPDLKPGLVVEIIGRPWTYDGALKSGSAGWVEDLDEGEREMFSKRAVVIAESVRPPGRIEVRGATN